MTLVQSIFDIIGDGPTKVFGCGSLFGAAARQKVLGSGLLLLQTYRIIRLRRKIFRAIRSMNSRVLCTR